MRPSNMEPKCEPLLVVALVERKPVGCVLAPYLVHADATSPVTLTVDSLARPLTVERLEWLTAEQKALVGELDKITNQGIAKALAPRKMMKAFYETLDADTVKRTVRPWVEKHIVAALKLMEASKTRLFLKDERFHDINRNDEVDIPTLFHCKPRFFFTLKEDGQLTYTLKVNDGATDVSLQGRPLRVLVENPAVIVSAKQLFSFEHIEAAKFRPFVKNQRITVPQNLVERYMATFVYSCLRYHPVQAYGFDIVKRQYTPSVTLHGLQTFSGAVFSIEFDYGGTRCASSLEIRPVEMTRVEGRYVFDVVQRDLHLERRVRETLLREGGLEESGIYLSPGPAAESADLAEWVYRHDDLLAAYNIKVVNTLEFEVFLGAVKLATHVDRQGDWFDIDIAVTVGGYSLPFALFIPYIKKKVREYPLPNGRVFVIPQEWFEEWSPVIPFAKTTSSGVVRVSVLHSELLPLLSERATPQEREAFTALPGYQPSAQIRAQLRPYQLVGLQWLLHITRQGRGAILADDMGLGKTLQTIAMLAEAYNTGQHVATDFPTFNDTGLPPTLVVMPVSLIDNWRAELLRFTPQLKVYTYINKWVVTGLSVPRILAQYHIVLTSYGHLRNYIEALGQVEYLYMILDESHLAKNPSSKLYGALTHVRSQRRVNLTGTPIENSLTDLWAQMNIANPGLLGTKRAFDAYFRQPIENHDDAAAREALRGITAPYILRRTKEQVLDDLPSITVQTVACPMDEEQASVYEREKSAVRNILTSAEGSVSHRFAVLQALTRLRLIANHPVLCLTDYEGGSGKTEIVLRHIHDISSGGNKMLVFSSFVRDLRLIASRLEAEGTKYALLTGQTTNRQQVIDCFNTEADRRVFLISLKAGGVGLNLTAASYVLILNPWWNPAAEQQAYGRAHRIGQRQAVTVYRFISTDSIEEKIDQLQTRKLALATSTIDATPSDEELDALLSEEKIA